MTGKTAGDAEAFPASEKKSDLRIVFVHHQTGNKSWLRRHISFVNEAGYDAVGFTMTLPSLWPRPHLPVAKNFKLGLKYLWSDQITDVLNQFPGKKVVYGFSNPCSAAIHSIQKRRCHDIAALICDSGPTARLTTSTYKYFRKNKTLGFFPTQLASATGFRLAWSSNNKKELRRDLDKFPDGFPVLSIRGWKDTVIPPNYIDEVFNHHPHLDWRKLNLPEAEHLDGLKFHKNEYEPQVLRFLEGLSF